MLNRFIRLDVATGRLYWLPRVANDFDGIDAKAQIAACQTWNTRFAGKECFDWFDKTKGEFTGVIFGKTYRRAVVVWILVHGEAPAHRIGFKNKVKTDTRPDNLYIKQRTRS